MEKFEIHILGCGSALPTTRHYPSSQVINLREKLFMIDCGEGAQTQLRRSQLHFSRLNHIFISHLHGDHCFGLIGLISTFGLLGRTSTLHIYAPQELENILRPQLDFFCQGINYEINIHAINPYKHEIIYEDRSVTVYSLPLKHRIPCCGFLFEEKQTLSHIKRDMIDFYKIPTYAINNIKAGANWTTAEGEIINNSLLTTPAEPAKKYAYCSDTAYEPRLKKYIQNIDLLFHEATFGCDNTIRAKQTFHSTASQAATLALNCNVKRLCIGHFSARYDDETILLNEAKEIFSNTLLAKENLIIHL